MKIMTILGTRQETLEARSNLIAGCEPAVISRGVKTVLTLGSNWESPREYMVPNVSKKIQKNFTGGVELSEYLEYNKERMRKRKD